MEVSKIVNTRADTIIETTQTNHAPESQERNEVEVNTSSVKETSPQKSESITEPVQENDAKNKPVPFLNNSHNIQAEIQETDNDSTANNLRTFTKTAPRIEDMFVRDENTNELYMPLSSTIIPKWEKRSCTSLWISKVAKQ